MTIGMENKWKKIAESRRKNHEKWVQSMRKSKLAPVNTTMRLARFRAQLSLIDLQQKTGLSKTALSSIERMKAQIREDAALKIARALDTEVSAIFRETSDGMYRTMEA